MSDEALTYRPPTPMVVWLSVGSLLAAHGLFIMAPAETQDAISYALALIPERFHAGSLYRFNEWYDPLWPLFGHVFLHAGWLHVGLNAFFLFAASRQPARLLGPWRFLALFFVSALGGALLFLALNWDTPKIAVGASGALCGVFSAYFLSMRRDWRAALAEPVVRNQFASMFILNVVLMGAAATWLGAPIAWEAHLGGFIAGALAWIVLAPRTYDPPD